MRVARTAPALLAALVLAAAGAAACGDDDSGSGGGGNGKRVTVKVGTLPIASAAPLYLGRQKGFFRDEGIEVKPQLQQGGNEVVTGVQGGSFDFGYAGPIPIAIARAKGLPVQIVAATDDQGKDPSKADVITVARKDTDIRSAKDLEGKTVGVNLLGGVAEVVIKASVENAGGDPSKVKLVEVPFPEMVAALDSKRIDAGFVPEPFRLLAEQGGARPLEDTSYQAADPKGFEVGVYFATEKYIGENTDVVDRFVRASNRAADYAADHPDEARKAISTYTEIPPKLVSKIRLPRWNSDLRQESVELQAELAKRFGIIKEVPDIDQLIR
jgi:NitT/TauT family transport system substrate-binding protein